jgi:uncharacterized membrane protein YeaQ/YmgE (transglycosylase-associated protein family)
MDRASVRLLAHDCLLFQEETMHITFILIQFLYFVGIGVGIGIIFRLAKKSQGLGIFGHMLAGVIGAICGGYTSDIVAVSDVQLLTRLILAASGAVLIVIVGRVVKSM